jgi:Rad52/22 family double-strand break repair protein
MGFSSKQVAALRRNVDQRHIRVRQSNGRELSYLEGWYVISQANRIFGFDGWSRETLESKCVLSRENRGYFTAVYTAKVRLTVQANGASIIREGHGTGEGRGEFPGEVHDTALKSAETDATKRALATFGRPFGLELYRGTQAAKQGQGAGDVRRAVSVPATAVAHPAQSQAVDKSRQSALPTQAAPELAPLAKFARDDATPIPRPSKYYGREHYHDIRAENAGLVRQAARNAANMPSASDNAIVDAVSRNLASTSSIEPTSGRSGCGGADRQVSFATWRAQAHPGQGASQICGHAALFGLWEATVGRASPALCATAGARDEGQQ